MNISCRKHPTKGTLAAILGSVMFCAIYVAIQSRAGSTHVIPIEWLVAIAKEPPFGSRSIATAILYLGFWIEFSVPVVIAAFPVGLLSSLFTRNMVLYVSILSLLFLFGSTLFIVLLPRPFTGVLAYPTMCIIVIASMYFWYSVSKCLVKLHPKVTH